jgi:hypothetical protein
MVRRVTLSDIICGFVRISHVPFFFASFVIAGRHDAAASPDSSDVSSSTRSFAKENSPQKKKQRATRPTPAYLPNFVKQDEHYKERLFNTLNDTYFLPNGTHHARYHLHPPTSYPIFPPSYSFSLAPDSHNPPFAYLPNFTTFG